MRNWKYINGAEVGNSVSENSWSPMQARKYLEEAKKSGDKSKIDEIKKIIEAEYYAAYKKFDELSQKKNDYQINEGKEGRIPHLEEARKNYELWKIIKHQVGNTKVKKTLFKSLATPTTWTPGINGRPITGAPEFKGTFAKDEADKWTDKWIKDHGFEAENKTGNSDGVARMFQGLVKDEDKDEKHYEGAIDDLEKVGNASKIYQHKLYPNKYVVVDEDKAIYTIITDGKVEKTGEYNMAVDKGISQIYKRVSSMNSKTGNAIGGGVQSEAVLTEAKDGSQYWVEKTSKSGQYAQYNLYYTIGQGKRHAGVFKDKEAAVAAGRRIIGNSSSNEEYWKKQYIEAARKKRIPENKIQEFIKKIEKEGAKGVLSPIKNEIGNSYSDKLPTAMDYRKALDEIIEKKNLNPDEARRKYGQFTYAQWEKELGHKIGNSEDEKFAYVMREFKEGKLKSSSGETVTDPAQAKAIAYSESKRAENGLARARKAIH